jgi:hypothetical protein
MQDNQERLSMWKWVLNMRLHARIGAAVSVIFACGIGGGLAARYLPHGEIFVWGSSAGLMVAGLLALRRGAESESEQEQSADAGFSTPQSTDQVTQPEYRPSVFTRRYWGWVSLGCAVAVFLAPSSKPKVVARASPPSVVQKKQPPPPPLETNEPAIAMPTPVVFPTLKLQGIHLLPRHPAAIINGKTYVAGDVVAGVSVVQINSDSVMVEMGGEKRRLLLANAKPGADQ